MRPRRLLLGSCFLLCSAAAPVWAADPCKSGLEPGQRPGPYAALIATGKDRGQSCCYICDTGDKPAVVVFARGLTDSLGKLALQLDKAAAHHQAAGLRAWVTFLNDDQPAFDPRVADWAKRHALRTIPLGVFEDTEGPPSYRLSNAADVTILLFVQQKVVANFAYRSGELKDEQIETVLASLAKMIGKK